MADETTEASVGAAPGSEGPSRSWLASIWNAVAGAVGAVLGLAPHVLHHIGILGGAFLVAGVAGNLLFGGLGLLLTLPLLMRLFRRYGTWKAPAVGVAVFAVMFSLSTFVVGPALTGGDEDPTPSTPTPSPAGSQDPNHDEHHQ